MTFPCSSLSTRGDPISEDTASGSGAPQPVPVFQATSSSTPPVTVRVVTSAIFSRLATGWGGTVEPGIEKGCCGLIDPSDKSRVRVCARSLDSVQTDVASPPGVVKTSAGDPNEPALTHIPSSSRRDHPLPPDG